MFSQFLYLKQSKTSYKKSQKKQKKRRRLKKDKNTMTSTIQASSAYNSKNIFTINRARKNLSHIIYYKYNKSEHFANKYLKSYNKSI